jgi:hypothetical protein
MAQAMERWLATPKTTPVFPSSNGIKFVKAVNNQTVRPLKRRENVPPLQSLNITTLNA